MAFKRMTKPQAQAYSALQALGWMIVSPQDARPLKALKARGLIVYKTLDGIRHAVLKDTPAQVARNRREQRQLARFDEWVKQTRGA